MGRKIDLTGKRFGMLVVIRETYERKNKKIIWECKCDCGKNTEVKSGCLLSGDTTSCGCKIPWLIPYIEYSKTFGREDYLSVCKSTKTKKIKNMENKDREKINIKNKVKELRNRGLKVKEIAKMLGLSMSQVNRRLNC